LDGGGKPEKADAALVLAGGSAGDRVTLAGDLVKEGYAPIALVSGPPFSYGVRECELAIGYAVRQGYDAKLFECADSDGTSTYEEAEDLIPTLRKKGVKKYLLVSTDSHTRRAAGIFRDLAPDLQCVPVSSHHPWFRLDEWWKTREGRKAVFYEWVKTITSWFGM
jgi:uncharacterized SAM-binding protein YcdF (DUF218 family)